MNFREIAERDLSFTLEDSVYGFGWPITITDSDGLTKKLSGQSNDISLAIDPETGQAVSGRNATIVLRIKSLEDAGFSALPAAQADKTKKPWIVSFDDIRGKSYDFTIKETNPDRSIGIIFCTLEFYKS